MQNRRYVLLAVTGLLILFIDQVSKYFVIQKLSISGEFSVISDFAAFHFYPNYGIAFGIPITGLWLIPFYIFVFGVLLYIFNKHLSSDNRAYSFIAIGLIIGGAIGNIIDRIRLGYVVDFIQISVFPVFNIADIAVFLGVLLLIWRVLTLDKENMRSVGEKVKTK